MMTAISTAQPSCGLEGPSAGRTVDIATPQDSTYRRGNPVQSNGAGSSPGPAQPDGPPIFIGGAVKASALRAARIGDGFNPPVTNPEFIDCYRAECKRLGRPVGRIIDSGGPLSVHVSRDPERDWPRVGQFMFELNAYSKWSSDNGIISPFNAVKESIEALKASGLYLVLTPDQCVDFFNAQMAKNQDTHFTPLCGGLPPDIAWESLELLGSEVLPRIKR